MSRQIALVAGLVAVLLIVVFFLLLWRPQSERIAEIEAEREAAEQEQVELQARIDRLEEVRRDAPVYAADIVAAESVVPRETAMPPAFRQLQTAADDAGVELLSISPDRPTPLEEGPEGLAAIRISLEVNGEYFEIVDFLRRIEDPAVTARGLVWTEISVAPVEHPELTLSVSGEMYAQVPPVDTVDPPDDEEDGDDDEDVDVELDVDEEDEAP